MNYTTWHTGGSGTAEEKMYVAPPAVPYSVGKAPKTVDGMTENCRSFYLANVGKDTHAGMQTLVHTKMLLQLADPDMMDTTGPPPYNT